MGLQDWQVKTPTIFGHRKMDAIFVHVLPFQRLCFRLPQAREEKQLVERRMDGVFQRVDLIAPFSKVINDRAGWAFLIPLDGHRRAFRQVMHASGMVPDSPTYLSV